MYGSGNKKRPLNLSNFTWGNIIFMKLRWQASSIKLMGIDILSLQNQTRKINKIV